MADGTLSPFAKTMLLLEADLKVLSPLHLGTGDRETNNRLDVLETGQRPELATILRDVNSAPYIPGTSLKGAMLDLAQDKIAAGVLFGERKDEDTGFMGQLIVYGASVVSKLDHHWMPHYTGGAGVMTRTRIDPDTGTALDKHLFNNEEVPAGTVFAFRALMMTDDPAALTELQAILQRMAGGFYLGAGTSSGNGRVQLGAVRLTPRMMQPDGTVTYGARKDLPLPPVKDPRRQSVALRLTCDGPYLVNDSAWPAVREKKKKENVNAQLPQLKALGITNGGQIAETVLPGTSLKGALRAVSLWLERGHAHQTDVLFGDTDRAALFRIDTIESTGSPTRADVASVKLDRFTGGPFHSGLFDTRCFVNPEFEVTLSHTASGEVAVHFETIIKHICDNGIRLGHGSNRGFGWFTAKIVETE